MTSGVKGTKAPHGTTSRYTNQRCRCAKCREAWRNYCRERNHVTGRHMPMSEWLLKVTRHGYSHYRSAGCRCDECLDGARTAWRRQKARQRAAA